MSSYYVSIRQLCNCCFPLRVTRKGSVTLVVVDPRATKAEMLEATIGVLDLWEYDAARRAYGQPPAGHPMDEFFLEGAVMPYVPPSIRVPGEPPIQNPDLESRDGLDAFEAAIEWYDLETRLMSVSA